MTMNDDDDLPSNLPSTGRTGIQLLLVIFNAIS